MKIRGTLSSPVSVGMAVGVLGQSSGQRLLADSHGRCTLQSLTGINIALALNGMNRDCRFTAAL